MAVAYSDGALGIEARHIWLSDGRVVTLNELNNDTGVGGSAVLPRIKLNTIGGLFSLPEADEAKQVATGRVGELFYPTIQRGKTVTYEGLFQARTLQDLRALTQEARAGFASLGEGLMVVRPRREYAGTLTDDYDFIYTARSMTLDMTDEQTFGPESQPTAYQRAFSLTLRMGDPRLYRSAVQSATAVAGVATCAVGGMAPTDPMIEVDGAWTVTGLPATSALAVTDFTADRSLAFAGLDFTGTLRIDFKLRRAYDVATGTMYTGRLVVPQSTWWDALVPGFAPGTHSVGFLGASASGMTVNWRDAYW